jgi:hypothetical protein
MSWLKWSCTVANKFEKHRPNSNFFAWRSAVAAAVELTEATFEHFETFHHLINGIEKAQ